MRLGLLGAASITPRSIIAPASRLGNVSVHAIAASNLERANRFAQTHGIALAFGDYATLLAREDVDAVYIALPNHLHAPMCIAAARAGKHVLVEKPLCLGNEEAEQICREVRANGIWLLEGVMTQHHPWEARLASIVRERQLGELQSMKTVQTFRLERSDNYRFSREFGGGVLLDEACYWLRLLQALDLLPLRETRCELTYFGGVDVTCRVEALVQRNVHAEAVFSYELPYEATHHLFFTDGSIRIRNYLAPSLGAFRIRIELLRSGDTTKEVIRFEPDNYFMRQLDFFTRTVRGEQEGIALDQSLERVVALSAIQAAGQPRQPRPGDG
jgi:dTDP-3,4-didehydro-2,6-dideoxy-alpha-D-glucose 3-reductase